MVYCKECGTELSVLDKVCPYCGNAGSEDESAAVCTRSPKTTTMKRPVYVALPCRYCSSVRRLSIGKTTEDEKCPVCGGAKKIIMKKPFTACPSCNGTGILRNGDCKRYEVCETCGGTGWVNRWELLFRKMNGFDICQIFPVYDIF